MDTHLEQLLKAVIEEYVATAEPVGSQHLVERYRLDVSPATIRNWFADLEEAGYLEQPHTSGGRVPTEKGFRYYINTFVRNKPANKRERETLEKAASFDTLRTGDKGARLKNVARALAGLSGQAAFVELNEADTFYTGLSQLFSQPEFENRQNVVALTEALEGLDETLRHLQRRSFSEPQALVGGENPFGSGYGAVVVSFEDGLIGLIGPLRLDYQSCLSLIFTTLDLLT